MFALSFVCHLIVVAAIFWFSAPGKYPPAQEAVTYVDLMTPPVASPQAGTPAPAEKKAAQPAAPPAPAPQRPTMTLPAPKTTASKHPPPTPAKGAKPAPPVEDAREFNERLEKVERQAEEKRQAEVLARLRKGAGGNRTVGMPGAKGTQAGSDYSSYIQSRLKDAFKQVIASQTGSPQTLVRLTIGADGRIANYQVEKRSGDPVFDDAVSRAVTLASRNFKPPPGGVPFERVFRFKPEGVALP